MKRKYAHTLHQAATVRTKIARKLSVLKATRCVLAIVALGPVALPECE